MESTEHGTDKEEHHSTGALLALQLALARVLLRRFARAENGTSGLPLHAVGLPSLKKRRKSSAENASIWNLQHRNAGLQTPSSGASYGGRLSNDPCNSSTLQPSTGGDLWSGKAEAFTSGEDHVPAVTPLQSKEDLHRPSLEENDPEESLSKEDLETPNDEEGLTYSCDGREDFLFSSNQSSAEGELDDTSDESFKETNGDESFKETNGLDILTARMLPDDVLQSKISSTSQFPQAQPLGSAFLDQSKEGSWASGIKFDRIDDRAPDVEINNFLHSSQTSLVPNDGATLSHSRALLSSVSENAPERGVPENRQADSLLFWPFGLAVEAVAFQVRLIGQAFSLVAMLYDWCSSFASNKVRDTRLAKERATEALSQNVAKITTVPPKFTESGSTVLKRAVWGCLAASYVCLLLIILLFPALLLDYAFLSRIVEDPVSIEGPIHFDYTLHNPTAIVPLHPFIGKLGSHSERTRALPVSHKVHITVFLTLPESEYNRKLGIFQLTSELLSETDEIIKSSSRPCILRFYSFPIRVIKTFLISLPSLLGMFTESQTLEVHLMEFEEQPIATHAVRIIVQSKAGMPLGQGIPEIYSAHVHIESHLPWLKNIMRSWKWTVYIWTGLAFYVTEIFMVLCCCRRALLPTLWFGGNDESKDDEAANNNLENTDESHASRNGNRREHFSTRRPSPYEHIPTARAVVSRKERNLMQNIQN